MIDTEKVPNWVYGEIDKILNADPARKERLEISFSTIRITWEAVFNRLTESMDKP